MPPKGAEKGTPPKGWSDGSPGRGGVLPRERRVSSQIGRGESGAKTMGGRRVGRGRTIERVGERVGSLRRTRRREERVGEGCSEEYREQDCCRKSGPSFL